LVGCNKMVEINELPIAGKIKEKFITYLKEHPIDSIHLGDFQKLKGGDDCNVCGHALKWAFYDDLDKTAIGICCGVNIIALQKCKGNFDKLNFDRIVKLEKKTIIKRQKEWEKKQVALKLEIKYNEEFKFCIKVVELASEEKAFESFVGERDGNKFFYAGLNQDKHNVLKKIYQCDSWLSWLRQGSVSEYYLGELHKLQSQTPQQIVDEAKEKFIQYQEQAEKNREIYRIHQVCRNKVIVLKEHVRLGLYDTKFVKSLYEQGQEMSGSDRVYSEKQQQAINKLYHKYRSQIQSFRDSKIEALKKEREGCICPRPIEESIKERIDQVIPQVDNGVA